MSIGTGIGVTTTKLLVDNGNEAGLDESFTEFEITASGCGGGTAVMF